MRKLFYFIALLFVSYLVCLSLFPSKVSSIFNQYGLGGFNSTILSVRDTLRDTLENYDLFSKFKETRDKTLEIKQNIETGVETTKQKIETIQTNVDKTTKAINETTNSINKTVDSINELQKSITNVANFSGSGSGTGTSSGTQN